MADINKSSETVTSTLWKMDGELFESVWVECLPLTKTGLKVLEKKLVVLPCSWVKTKKLNKASYGKD